MTKAWVALAALGALLTALPIASAHGAPPVREVDTRVLLDDDGLVMYGGCVQGNCQPVAPSDGLDVLAVDVREAYLPDGFPAVVFRLIVQSEAPVPGSTLVLHVQGPAGAMDFTASTQDGTTWTSPSFDRLDGPFDVGDGHPKALDAWMRYSSLGAKPGDALSGMTLLSQRGDTKDDVMPGGWFEQGQEVPPVPDEADPGAVTDAAQPGNYTLRGPAALITLKADPATPSLTGGRGSVKLTLSNAVTLPQFCDLTAYGTGLKATFSSSNVLLSASGARTIDLALSNVTEDGVLRVAALSDLGGLAVANMTLTLPPPVLANVTPSSTTGAPAKDSPALPWLAVPTLVVALALWRRR